jgi:hypothetical protein
MALKLSPEVPVTQIRENSPDFTEEKCWWIVAVCLFQSPNSTYFAVTGWLNVSGEVFYWGLEWELVGQAAEESELIFRGHLFKDLW